MCVVVRFDADGGGIGLVEESVDRYCGMIDWLVVVIAQCLSYRASF